MLLNNGREEFELAYTIGELTGLKKCLNSKNLRKDLLKAIKNEDYAVLASAVRAFSRERIKRTEDAYPVIDRYMLDSGNSAPEMFLQLISEMDDAGFFMEHKTLEELREMLGSPELELDMEELYEEIMRQSKERMLETMLNSMSTPTGASLPPISVAPLMEQA